MKYSIPKGGIFRWRVKSFIGARPPPHMEGLVRLHVREHGGRLTLMFFPEPDNDEDDEIDLEQVQKIHHKPALSKSRKSG